MTNSLGASPLIFLLTAAAAGGTVLIVWALHLIRRQHELTTQLERAKAELLEQSRHVSRLRTEQGGAVNLGLILPLIVNELNRADLNTRRVPALIAKLADAIFQPRQILVFITRRHDQISELQLVHTQGLSDVPDRVKTIPFGRGRIGWVAAQRVERFREDWPKMERREGQAIEADHRTLDLEMIAPIVQHGAQGETVLGVICIGTPNQRQRDEKTMLQLISNLGSLALINASNLSALRDQAHHDGLTGLFNKAHFQFKFASMLLQAGKSGDPLALFIFDVDHFKNFNDTNGHPAGDVLLRQLSDLVRDNVRPADICCRYGGEEFVVAMPHTDAEDALAVAERVRSAIEQYPFLHEEHQPNGRLTVSGGLSVFPRDGVGLEELMENADQALYRAKRSGRNKVLAHADSGFENPNDVGMEDWGA